MDPNNLFHLLILWISLGGVCSVHLNPKEEVNITCVAPDRVEIVPQPTCKGTIKCCMDGHCDKGCRVIYKGSSDSSKEKLSLVFEDVSDTTAPDVKLLTQNDTFDQRTDHEITIECDTTGMTLVDTFRVRYYR